MRVKKNPNPVWLSIRDGDWQISKHFQKILEIVACTSEIVEIKFQHGSLIDSIMLFMKIVLLIQKSKAINPWCHGPISLEIWVTHYTYLNYRNISSQRHESSDLRLFLIFSDDGLRDLKMFKDSCCPSFCDLLLVFHIFKIYHWFCSLFFPRREIG